MESPAITLQSKSGQLAHVRDVEFSQTHLNAKLLNGKPASVALDSIQWIIPSHLLKQVEQLDKGTKYEVDGAEDKPGLHFIFSESPPMAVLASSPAYKSQLFQMSFWGSTILNTLNYLMQIPVVKYSKSNSLPLRRGNRDCRRTLLVGS